MAKVVRRKLNVKALLVLILAFYLIGMLVYYLFTMPIKNIVINGNIHVMDNEIITAADLGEKPSLFRTSTKDVEDKIEALDLVKEVKIKKSLNGTIHIQIVEETVLFYNKPSEKYVLSSAAQVEIKDKTFGVPTLINYTPTEILEKLVKKLLPIDMEIICLISEIEYSPKRKNDIMIDEFLFTLKMNDGNRVLINLANFEKLGEYKRLFATIGEEEKGTFYLDGSVPDVVSFSSYEAENKKKEENPDELPE